MQIFSQKNYAHAHFFPIGDIFEAFKKAKMKRQKCVFFECFEKCCKWLYIWLL